MINGYVFTTTWRSRCMQDTISVSRETFRLRIGDLRQHSGRGLVGAWSNKCVVMRLRHAPRNAEEEITDEHQVT